MQIPFGRPILGSEEKAAVMQVLSGDILTHGPKVKEFEALFASYTGAPYALAVASGTAALHLTYFYLGIGPGDEVIVPAQSHVATAHAVELCGAKPVFVDAEESTGNINAELIEMAITERTKAISVVHFLGLAADMVRIQQIASRFDLFVVEDCALAMGTKLSGRHAGLHGDVGCFSFYPVKHITTGEGGMLVTKHERVAHMIAKQRAFGIDRNVVAERKIPGIYDVEALGFNYRMNEISAVLGVEQMKKIPEFLHRRKENFETLRNELKDVEEVEILQGEEVPAESQPSYYCLSVLLKEDLARQRTRIIEFLKQSGIGTSIYYPQPIPRMTYYKEKYGYDEARFPVASQISDRSIALPVGPHLNPDHMKTIVALLKKAMLNVSQYY